MSNIAPLCFVNTDLKSSVADPERVDADPDPTFQADADPDPYPAPDPDPNPFTRVRIFSFFKS